jgi:hypothetical protein
LPRDYLAAFLRPSKYLLVITEGNNLHNSKSKMYELPLFPPSIYYMYGIFVYPICSLGKLNLLNDHARILNSFLKLASELANENLK